MDPELGFESDHDLPDDVRKRIKARVDGQVAHRRPNSPNRARRWLPPTVAASIVGALAIAIAAGIGLTTRAGEESAFLPKFSAIAEGPPSQQARQCRDALASEQPDAPPATEWDLRLSLQGDKTTVLGFMVRASPVLCEISKESTTVSRYGQRPEYTTDGLVGFLLLTPNGTIAGVAAPEVPILDLEVTSPGKDRFGGPAFRSDGFFAFSSVVSIGNAILDSGSGASPVPVPKSPISISISLTSPPVTVPQQTQAFETLRQCGSKAADFTPQRIRPGSTPGAAVTVGQDSLVMIRTGSTVGACLVQGERAQILTELGNVADATTRPLLLPISPTLDNTPLVAGIAPTAAQSIEILPGAGGPVEVTVDGGTFAALVPNHRAGATLTCKVRDASGAIIYSGSLAS